jgi:putative membrane protein
MKTYSPKIVSFLSLNAAVAALCLFAQMGFSTARAADENHGQLTSADYKFAVDASRANTEEITLGQLAAQKATDPAVQQYAQRMIQDHTKANQQLSQIIAQKGATLPTTTTTSQEKETDHLAKLSGTDFDKAYMGHMVKDHKKDVKEFQKAADNAKDPDLKAFAANTLPTLQEHLQMAENTEAALKGAKP